MQNLLLIDSLTVSKLEAGDFTETLPELYRLNHVLESQDWHNNQTVFDHSIKSLKALELIMEFSFLQPDERATANKYLDSSQEIHTRRSLLRLATLLHDIGKLVSLQHNSQGNTGSPSHGTLGGWVAKPVLETFDIARGEKEFVLDLISNHLVPSDLIEMSINNNTSHLDTVELLHNNRPDIVLELLMLAYADWLGCDIREPVRDERDKRIEIVHKCIAATITKLGES